MEKLKTISLVLTSISTKQTLHPHKFQICSLCSPMTWAKWSIQQHNNTYIALPLNYGHELVFIRLGIVEIFVDEEALTSYDGGSRAQLTHNDRDKRGHEDHDLEASRNFSFSLFTQGTAFLLL